MAAYKGRFKSRTNVIVARTMENRFSKGNRTVAVRAWIFKANEFRSTMLHLLEIKLQSQFGSGTPSMLRAALAYFVAGINERVYASNEC